MGPEGAARVLDEVLGLEVEVQSRQFRADQSRIVELFAPDFVEIGASGRLWDLESTAQMLQEESRDPDTEAIQIDDLHARPLAADVVQVFWTSTRAGRRARRTSIWRRAGKGWQLVYHQGTPIPE